MYISEQYATSIDQQVKYMKAGKSKAKKLCRKRYKNNPKMQRYCYNDYLRLINDVKVGKS